MRSGTENRKAEAFLHVALLDEASRAALLDDPVPALLLAEDGRTPLWGRGPAARLFGHTEIAELLPARLPESAPGTRRLMALAASLEPEDPPRLERLRFYFGFRDPSVTAQVRALRLRTGASALRVALIDAPLAETLSPPESVPFEPDVSADPIRAARPEREAGSPAGSDAGAAEGAPHVLPAGAARRFVFVLDAEGRVESLSPPLAATVGVRNAPEPGEKLVDRIAAFDAGAAADLAAHLDAGETWSGLAFLWPIENTDRGVPVELAADAPVDLPAAEPDNEDAGANPTEAQLPEEPVADSAMETPRLPESPEDAGPDRTVPAEAIAPPSPLASPARPARPSKVVPIRPGAEPPTGPEAVNANGLSPTERNAFRELAKALGARFEGADETEETPPPREAAPLPVEPIPVPAQPGPVPRHPVDAFPNVETVDPAFLDRLPIGLLVLQGDETLFVNRTLLDLAGYPDAAAFVAENGARAIFRKGQPPKAGPEGFDSVVLATRDGEMFPVDAHLQLVGWQGRRVTLLSFRRAVELEQGKALRTVALDLKRIRGEATELRAILDIATDGVAILDSEGRLLSLNGAGEALFGLRQNEIVGESFTRLLANESHALALDYLNGLKANGVRSVLNDGREVLGREKNGGRIPLFMTLGRISDDEPRRYCAVLRDLTAWKRAEAQLQDARRAAEQASAKKSDFLAKISHEIRTPMNAIIGFAEVMQEERLGPVGNAKYKEYLGDIQVSGKHVVSLVNDLLDLAKIEAGRMELTFAATDLNAVVASCVGILQPQANANRVLVRSQLASKLPPVVADERSMRQIVLNMLSNATRYTEAGGQVIVSTALSENGEAVIRIRDTGIGMTPTEIEQALEPFRQVGNRPRSGGTGLGLPLTKALVEANRAGFTIRSAPGEGTLVEIAFPSTRVLAEYALRIKPLARTRIDQQPVERGRVEPRDRRGRRGRNRGGLIVEAVDIRPEMDEPVLGHVAGKVDPGHRHRLGQPDVLAFARGDAGIDGRPVEPGLRCEQPGGEISDTLHPHAARGMEPVIAGEEPLRGRVVQIDRLAVRHVDAQLAKRVAGAGILSQGKGQCAFGRPIDRGRIDLLAAGTQNADLCLGKVGRVLAHLGQDVLLHDRDRHGPGRVEVDAGDPGGHFRRGPVGLADHRHAALDNAPLLDRLDGGGGNVDHHMARPEGEIPHGQPGGGRLELFQTRLDGRPQANKGRPLDPAVGRQPVPLLEADQPLAQFGIEAVALGKLAGEIAFEDKPTPQHLDQRAGRAGCEREPFGQDWPAAGAHDPPVALDRPADRLDRTGMVARARIGAQHHPFVGDRRGLGPCLGGPGLRRLGRRGRGRQRRRFSGGDEHSRRSRLRRPVERGLRRRRAGRERRGDRDKEQGNTDRAKATHGGGSPSPSGGKAAANNPTRQFPTSC